MIRRPLAAAVLLGLAAACGPPARPALPSGAGTPFAEFASAYDEAVADCSTVKTITAELALSGRAGTTKLRGRISAGLAAPADIVLEGLAPFGKSVFILTGRNGKAMLYLPRDNRILRDAEPAAIVEALAGVALSPAELRAAVSGCGLEKSSPTGGRSYGKDSLAIDAAGGTLYLRRVERKWRVAAAVRDSVTVQYDKFKAGRPGTVFVKTSVADLALRVSQVEINVPLEPRAFDLEIPPDAAPLTLEELRRSGPLGDRSARDLPQMGPGTVEGGLAPRRGPGTVEGGLAPSMGPGTARGVCPLCLLQ